MGDTSKSFDTNFKDVIKNVNYETWKIEINKKYWQMDCNLTWEAMVTQTSFLAKTITTTCTSQKKIKHLKEYCFPIYSLFYITFMIQQLLQHQLEILYPSELTWFLCWLGVETHSGCLKYISRRKIQKWRVHFDEDLFRHRAYHPTSILFL